MADEQTLGEFIQTHVPNKGDTVTIGSMVVRNAGLWPIPDDMRAELAREAEAEWQADELATEAEDAARAERGSDTPEHRA